MADIPVVVSFNAWSLNISIRSFKVGRDLLLILEEPHPSYVSKERESKLNQNQDK